MCLRNVFREGNEDGYSLIGVLLALALIAMITSGILMVINQIYSVSNHRTNHILAVQEVQNAGHWLTLDARRAVTIEPTADADGFPLTITWDDMSGNEYQAVYTLTPENILRRERYINQSASPDTSNLIAAYIDPAETSCSVTADNELIATVTSEVSIDRVTYIETRTYRVFPRRSLY